MKNQLAIRLIVFLILLNISALSEVYCQEVKISNELNVPVSGVKLTGGVLKKTFDRNIAYLLNNFSENDLLYVFRERAGMSNLPGKPFNWDKSGPRVIGSVAGLFLMGSGNALRWEENEALKTRMNNVVNGIAACSQSDGFIMAYPEDKTGFSENANYVRSWITHGLIDASIAGNEKALKLIRGHLDWFNHSTYIDKIVDNKKGYIPDHWIPYQGMISSTRMYLSPLGKMDDIELIKNHYQEDWWLDQLISNDNKAIYNRPEAHCYEITAFEAYLDMYRITGESRYLEAVLNAWEMLRNNWQMPGGSFALCERKIYPPQSYLMGAESRSGELCCSVFWIKLNQRLHQLFPDKEIYVSEIEKTIYNGCIGNQLDTNMICYSTVLHGNKAKPHFPPEGTCCEGQGVRLFGSLPEYLYSFSNDGIYVDIYAPSEVSWEQNKTKVKLRNKTSFPENDSVSLEISTPKPVIFNLSLRIPSYLQGIVDIKVNGKNIGAAIPGTYQHLRRTWKDGDKVTLVLPLNLKLTKYVGFDQISGFNRYSLEYGPVLLGLTGKFNFNNCTRVSNDPNEIKKWLDPVPGKPLHYRIKVDSGVWNLREDEAWSSRFFEYKPYYDIGPGEEFTVFPIIQF